MTRTLAVVALLAGCGSDIGVTKQSVCDGVKQQGEDTVDQPFDVDGDGAFDAANPDCAATYAAIYLDCDDADPTIPADAEVMCNAIDDDCNAETPDGADRDGDGYSECDDCADSVAEVNPGAIEVGCNELDDDCNADTPDGVDADGDGATACSDCNDASTDIGPGASEVVCNGVDDDCNADTPDGADADGDGWTQCDECDDNNAGAYPGGTEICDNGVDDDCNGDIDDGCISDYTDTWTLDDALTYQCIWGLINIDFNRVLIEDAYPLVTVDALGSGSQPGQMTGSFTTSTQFTADLTVPGSCREVYTFEANFTSDTTIEGTFSAEFIGSSSACFDCTSQSWTFTGSR